MKVQQLLKQYPFLNNPLVKIIDQNDYFEILIYDHNQIQQAHFLLTKSQINDYQAQLLHLINLINANQQLNNFKSKLQTVDENNLTIVDFKGFFKPPLGYENLDLDLIQATIKTLKIDHDCFQLLDLQNFYYLSPASLLISTKNQSIWQERYCLQNSITSVINYHPVENIKSALIEQTKKVLALVQINNLFNYYATTLVDHIKNSSDQFKKLIKALHQNTKFNVTINALNQVEINHYWKDTLITSYQWLLEPNRQNNLIKPTNEEFAMDKLHQTMQSLQTLLIQQFQQTTNTPKIAIK